MAVSASSPDTRFSAASVMEMFLGGRDPSVEGGARSVFKRCLDTEKATLQ